MQVTKCDRCGGSSVAPTTWTHLSDNKDYCKMCTKRLVRQAIDAMSDEELQDQIIYGGE